MTQPTQAQIGAIPTQIAWLRELAQRGGKGTVDGLDARSLGRIADTLAALAAAAELGDATGINMEVHKHIVALAIADTIERCAQVAENEADRAYMAHHQMLCNKIAAASRALKIGDAGMGQVPGPTSYQRGYLDGAYDTIERCAQVAENTHCSCNESAKFLKQPTIGERISAAIRALNNDH